MGLDAAEQDQVGSIALSMVRSEVVTRPLNDALTIVQSHAWARLCEVVVAVRVDAGEGFFAPSTADEADGAGRGFPGVVPPGPRRHEDRAMEFRAAFDVEIAHLPSIAGVDSRRTIPGYEGGYGVTAH